MVEEKLKCHNCDVVAGQLHIPGCDWEICPTCGGQMLRCDCKEKSGFFFHMKRIPYGTVREIAARMTYYSNVHVMNGFKKEIIEAIKRGLW